MLCILTRADFDLGVTDREAGRGGHLQAFTEVSRILTNSSVAVNRNVDCSIL